MADSSADAGGTEAASTEDIGTVQDESSGSASGASAVPHLQLDEIGHVYRSGDERVEAIRDINLDIQNGEVVCIVGASGCGKTTLLRIMSGLLDPTSGAIRIDGQEVRGISPDIGLIFQNYDDTLLKWKTVYENVALGAEMNEKDDVDVQAVTDRYIEMVGLEEFKDAKPKELSGGMKQRVQVARILAYDPDILLCDEPFGALDAQTKEKLQDEFLEILYGEETTTVFVTHDIEEAIYLGDTIYVFTAVNPGEIEETRRIDFDRPRFPKVDFESAHFETVAEEKKIIHEIMEL